MTKTILLIHGLWLTPLSWEHFKQYFTDAGYQVVTPGWPGINDRSVDEIRADSSPLAGVKISDVIDHYVGIINSLGNHPILIGHSLGGLIVQLLIDRGLGSAGVAIDSAAPAGVLSFPISTMRATLPILSNPRNMTKAVTLNEAQFSYAFTNGMPSDQAHAAYKRYAVPAPGKVLFQTALGHLAPKAESRVNMRNHGRAPLLIIAGGNDHTMPAKTSKAIYRKHRKSTAVTDIIEFPDRNHLLMVQDGWEEIAHHIEVWLVSNSM